MTKHKASGCTKARREPSRYLCSLDPRGNYTTFLHRLALTDPYTIADTTRKRIVNTLTNYVIHYGKREILNKCRKT